MLTTCMPPNEAQLQLHSSATLSISRKSIILVVIPSHGSWECLPNLCKQAALESPPRSCWAKVPRISSWSTSCQRPGNQAGLLKCTPWHCCFAPHCVARGRPWSLPIKELGAYLNSPKVHMGYVLQPICDPSCEDPIDNLLDNKSCIYIIK